MDHQEERGQQAGHDPRQEQRAHRGVGDHAVEHHRDRGRHQRPDDAGRAGERAGELGRVAVLLHRLDLEQAEPARVGDRRAGHAGEDQAARHVDVAEPAGEVPDERAREAVDALGHAAGVHGDAGEDEAGHGEQREGIDAAEHAMQHGEIRQCAVDHDVEE